MPERGARRCFASPARSVSGAVLVGVGRIWPGKAVMMVWGCAVRVDPCLVPHGQHPREHGCLPRGHRSCLSPPLLPHTSLGPADRGDGRSAGVMGLLIYQLFLGAGRKDNPH